MRAVLSWLLVALLVSPCVAQPCRKIHGRAVWYRGDGFFAIWHVGTHHNFMLVDKPSTDLVCKYFDCVNGEIQPALFADFTVCPTEKYIEGAAQPVIVTKVEHPHVIRNWPPEGH